MRSLIATAAALALTGCVSMSETGAARGGGCAVGKPMVETMLFLGLARPSGQVSEEEFRRFIEAEVTPRWKEGYTILEGQGLWYSEQRQVTEREPSRVLVRIHDASADASAGVEAIRSAYIKAFMQDAVLRVDRAACVDF